MDGEMFRRYRAEYERKQKDYQRFVESIQGLEPFEKAESYLWYVANNIEDYGDQEAIIYLVSRGYDCSTQISHIVKCWKEDAHWSIEETSKGIPFSTETGGSKRIGGMSIAEARNVESLGGVILRDFWGGTDKQELSIDATMFRAVEWCQIGGFEEWWRRLAKEVKQSTLQGGTGPAACFFLFNMCRSDFAIQLLEKALKWQLEALEIPEYQQPFPWRRMYPVGKYEFIDHIPYAATIPFVNHRLYPGSAGNKLVGQALEALLKYQSPDGWWPCWTDSKGPSIEATAFAIHALATFKPRGWKIAASSAQNWLWSVQEKSGCWSDPVAPDPVYLTALVMDAIELSNNGDRVTYNCKYHPTHHPCADDDPHYDYEGIDWHDTKLPQIKSVRLEDIPNKIDMQLLLITATENELRQVLRLLEPFENEEEILKVVTEYETYYLGKFGAFAASVVRSGMGSMGPLGSALTANAAIKLWKPSAVIVVGIAFGINKAKHKPADVLIAERLALYENQRISSEIVSRGSIPITGLSLLNRFKNAIDWSFERPDGTKVKMHVGQMLSGNKLIDDPSFKQELIKMFPDSIGGEMEGAGVFDACSRARIEFIVVKGVSDWADGKKHDGYQEMAAASATSLAHHVLSEENAMDGLSHLH
jgi:nucleoside phosphorylase